MANRDTISVPLEQGVTLVEVVPGRIAVNIEAVEEKDIEVMAQTTGNVAAGFEIYSTAVLPPKISVRGPASVVRTIEFVQTDRIDITGKKDGFTARQIAVTSPDPKAAVLNTVVDVAFRIGEHRFERAFITPVIGLAGKTLGGLGDILSKLPGMPGAAPQSQGRGQGGGQGGDGRLRLGGGDIKAPRHVFNGFAALCLADYVQ